MSAEPLTWNPREAEAHLRAVSPQLAQVIAQVGPCRLGEAQEKTDLFTALATAIVYQQLAGRVAEKIWTRFAALFGDAPPSPERLEELDDTALRSAGLSRQKIGHLRVLAAKCLAGLSSLAALSTLPIHPKPRNCKPEGSAAYAP